ncbi:MAG: glycosyltransferase family 39 protein [Victivallales bacterium]|nr:glycosyltransferase family 39 protein [Victivallales bacterium]
MKILDKNVSLNFDSGTPWIKHPIVLLLAAMVIYTIFFAIVAKAEMIWYDEAFSLASSHYSCHELWEYSKQDVHMPTYHFILKAWQFFFGESICAAKAFSLLAILMTTVLVYRIGMKIEERHFALQCAVAYMIFPGVCVNATEIRMYALTGFFLVAATLFLIRIVERPPCFSDYCLFSLSMLVCLSLLSAAVIYAASFSIVLLSILILKKETRKIIYGLFALGAIGLVYLPILFTRLISQCNCVKDHFWTSKISLGDLFYIFITQYLGRGHWRCLGFVSFFILWLITLIGLYFILKCNDNRRKWIVLACMSCIALPLGFGTLASIIMGRLVLVGRALYPIIVFLVILHIYSLCVLSWKYLRFIGYLILLCMFIHQTCSYGFYMHHSRHKEMKEYMSHAYKDAPIMCFSISFGLSLSRYLPDHTINVDNTLENYGYFLPYNGNMTSKALKDINKETMLFITDCAKSEELDGYLAKNNFNSKFIASWEHEYSKRIFHLYEAKRLQ